MGDRYQLNLTCPNCLETILCYYAESCEATDTECPHCKKEFNIIMDFKLGEKSGKQ